MIDLSGSIWLGYIAKTHGIRGQVVLRLNNLTSQDIIKMETVFIEIDGLPVPFFINDYEELGSGSLRLSLEDIDNENKARELTTCKVYLPKDCMRIDTREDNIREFMYLKDFTVVDKQQGDLGIVKDIIDIEMNPLLWITNGKKDIYIPLHPEFIVKADIKKKKLYLRVPPDLLSLSL